MSQWYSRGAGTRSFLTLTATLQELHLNTGWGIKRVERKTKGNITEDTCQHTGNTKPDCSPQTRTQSLLWKLRQILNAGWGVLIWPLGSYNTIFHYQKLQSYGKQQWVDPFDSF